MNGRDYSAFGPYAGAVYAGFDRARGMQRQKRAESALATLATNPDDQQAFTNWLAADPEAAWKFKQQRDKQYEPFEANAPIVQRNRQTGAYETLFTPPPKPFNNDTVADYDFIAQKLGPEAAEQFLRNFKDGPPIAVDIANPDGSVERRFVPRSSMYGGQGGSTPSLAPQAGAEPPADAVAYLMANPGTARDFDAIFGNGAATRAIARARQGGAPSQGGATFP